MFTWRSIKMLPLCFYKNYQSLVKTASTLHHSIDILSGGASLALGSGHTASYVVEVTDAPQNGLMISAQSDSILAVVFSAPRQA